jgi:LuxR family maltose regulon positive regulatory protein
VIEILLLQALAHRARGENQEALTALERSLSLAEPGGYVRIFVDEGEPMVDLLRQATRRGIALAYVGKLLAACEAETIGPMGRGTTETPLRSPVSQPQTPAPRRPPSDSRGQAGGLVETLSERELEVLHLIAAGSTNREIAQKLVIAPTTAKKHVSNIIGKLGVTNRTQAVSQARERCLL